MNNWTFHWLLHY